MSERRPAHARTRAEDLEPPSRWERSRVWFVRWKDLIVAATACTAAVISIVAAWFVYDFNRSRAEDQRVVRVIAEQQAHSAKETAAAAKLSCERTREYGPGLADDYERRGVFTHEQIQRYRKTIPSSCPK